MTANLSIQSGVRAIYGRDEPVMIRSIRSRLSVLSVVCIALILIIAGLLVYYRTKNAVFDSIDRSLDSKINILRGLLHEEEGKIEFELSEALSGEYTIKGSGRYYVVIYDGDVFSVSRSLPDKNFNFALHPYDIHTEEGGNLAYSAAGPAGETVRVMRHDYSFLGKSARIYLAESIDESLYAIAEIRVFLFFIIPGAIVLTTLVSLWIVRYSLRPLRIFTSQVDTITHKNLSDRISSGEQTVELRRIADSFNEMLDRLQLAFETERRIISDTSHELKTPLAVIRAQCDVILQRERQGREYVEAIETVRTVVYGMSRIVEDILSLARIDSGVINADDFLPVSISDCLYSALSMAKVLARESGIMLRAEVKNDLKVSGSMERLTEAFLNIIENAVKYSFKGGRVEITTRLDHDMVSIRVRDSGTGISKDDIKRIFDRFFRSASARSTEGSGLGLSIALAIIRAHGGTIDVVSEPGHGSSFTVLLPSA